MHGSTNGPEGRVRWRLLAAGCAYSFRRRVWRCPACRTADGLRLRPLPDESIGLRCARGCSEGEILAELGLNFGDVGPAMFRDAS